MRCQLLVCEFLMPSVDALVGNILALLMQQVTDIVEQRRYDLRIRAAGLSCKECCLQAVLQHCDRLAEI
jgi:hypothetical protein